MSTTTSNEHVSSDACFPKTRRLLNKKEYDDVFARGKRHATKSFYSISVDAGEGQGKLGLIVAKKKLKLATGRNKVKRLVREWFRRNKNKNKMIAVGLRKSFSKSDKASDLNFESISSELDKHV
jgi:ribonuclease P protein component